MAKENGLTWRQVLPQLSWASGETGALTATLSGHNGRITQIIVKNSNATNAITVTVAITDDSSFTMFSAASIPENADNPLSAAVDITNDTYTFTVTPSGDPGASGMTTDIAIYGIQK